MQFKGGKCPKCGSDNCYLDKGLSEMMLASCEDCGHQSWNRRTFGWE